MELTTDKFPQTLFINSLVNDFDPAHEKKFKSTLQIGQDFYVGAAIQSGF